jgi:cell wall-associated NlpC family hydrolase
MTTPAAEVAIAPLFNSAPTAGPAGLLRVQQQTYFKLSPEPVETLADGQKLLISSGSSFGLMGSQLASNQHLLVTLTDRIGASNRNTWHVYAPHVEVIARDRQPVTSTTPVAVMTASVLPATGAPAASTVTSPPPTQPICVGNLNQAILDAALKLKGMSTVDGPDGGVNACAWSVNKVLQQAGIAPIGSNPNYVPAVLEALQNGRGQQVSREAAKAGDLVIAPGEAHIGIALTDGCTTVLSNSSSKRCFKWESDTDFDGYYGGGSSTIYRLLQ